MWFFLKRHYWRSRRKQSWRFQYVNKRDVNKLFQYKWNLLWIRLEKRLQINDSNFYLFVIISPETNEYGHFTHFVHYICCQKQNISWIKESSVQKSRATKVFYVEHRPIPNLEHVNKISLSDARRDIKGRRTIAFSYVGRRYCLEYKQYLNGACIYVFLCIYVLFDTGARLWHGVVLLSGNSVYVCMSVMSL